MRNIIFILLSFLLPMIGYSQATSVSLGTSNMSTLTLSNNTWTKVDPNITITANGNITGFRVQISQSFNSGSNGDQLRSTVTLPAGVSVSAFNQTTGILAFNGSASAAVWQNVLRGVEFRSTTNNCYTLQRRITFVAGSVFYNPLTEHFYEYVSGNITWTNSKTSAENRSYFGRVGYLATMASEAENNFIWKLMSSDGWFGASDEMNIVNAAKGSTVYASQAAVEGKWHWISGPEKGTNFSNGNAGSGPTTVSGQYAKWAGGEPNNAGGEHYGQFYSGNSGQWNDLPNTSLPGYICEYGGMPNDVTSNVTILTRNIEISGATSGYISGGDINICSGSNSTTLTLNGLIGNVARWEYSYDNFFTAGITISNSSTSLTVTNLTKTTYYRAIVNPTALLCWGLPTSSVFLSVKPTNAGTIFAANNSICSGGLVELTLSGQQGNVNKWQRSTNNTTWTDTLNTTTSLTETISAAGTYYYRVEVQTPNCGAAVYSDSKMITVTSGTPPIGGSVSSVNLSSTTNSGTVTLSGHSGTIVKWQRSTNDGVTWTDLVNTTTTQSYTNITTKTLFRVQLQSGTCGFAYSSNGVVQIVNTISGTISLPTGNPTISLSLFRIVNNIDTLVETINVNQNGTYSFNIPINNTTYKLVPSLTIQGITSTDFDLVWGEVQNINTPNNTSAGLIMTGTKQWKAADVNENGVLDLGDAYLVAAHISGMIPITKVLWFNSTDYDLITRTNFSTINAVTSFTINVTTVNVTQNIKYCIIGDVNLSHSSN